MISKHAIVVLATTAALAFGWSAASAQNGIARQTSPARTAPAEMQHAPSTALKQRAGARFRAPRATTVAPLTSSECTKLGGSVSKADAQICTSKNLCTRIDQHGNEQMMCIEVGT